MNAENDIIVPSIEVPLGQPLEPKVETRPCTKEVANRIHEKYHSYIDTPRHNSFKHYLVRLMGAPVGLSPMPIR